MSDKNNTANLKPYQWKAGQSGNPGGRPKTTPISDMYREIFSDPTNLELLRARVMKVLFSQKAKLSMSELFLLKDICDRLEGKVATKVDLVASINEGLAERLEKARIRTDFVEAQNRRPKSAPAPIIDVPPDGKIQ
jgi:Family of unknown function (DUF5681)